MKYKILVGHDLHKNMKDKTTIRGYVKVNIDVQVELIRVLKEGGFTHFISGGDWFDKGYGSDVAAALMHTDIDKILADAVNGNFYGVIGNHIKINLDSNPELFLIQPHPIYTTRHRVVRTEQIMKTPDYIVLNDVQISLMHWSKDAKDASYYVSQRLPGIKYHIAIYHTEMVVPSARLHSMGLHYTLNENSKIFEALNGVDLAIVGHIHKPLGTFRIDKNNGETTTMIVPGSLTNTDAGEGSFHSSIDMPVIEIDEDGHVALSYHHMDLFTNRLQFMKKELGEEAQKKLKTIRGKNIDSLYGSVEAVTILDTDKKAYASLNSFIQSQAYTPTDKDLINEVLNTPEDITSMVNTYKSSVVGG